jgi:hypothetical protein
MFTGICILLLISPLVAYLQCECLKKKQNSPRPSNLEHFILN